jgi:hypothetical protein
MGSRKHVTIRTVSGAAKRRFFEELREDSDGQTRDSSRLVGEVTKSPTWYMRGGPQLAAPGVAIQQSAKIRVGQEAIELKGVVESQSPDEELGSRTLIAC